jgi:hypothetical protein
MPDDWHLRSSSASEGPRKDEIQLTTVKPPMRPIEQWAPLYKFLIIAGVNVALLGVLLLTFELVFGTWLTTSVPPRAAIVGRSLNYRQALYDPPSEVSYVRDNYGLRGVHEPLERIELVTVGGSTTDQRYITEGKTWPDILRALTGLAVANAGIDGMSSFGHFLAVYEWLHRIANFHPKCYVHLIGVNDATIAFEPNWYGRSVNQSLLYREIGDRSAIARIVREFIENKVELITIRHQRVPPPSFGLIQLVETDFDGNRVREFIETIYKPNLRALLQLHRGRREIAFLVSQIGHPGFIKFIGQQVYGPPASSDATWPRRYALSLALVNQATEAVCREESDYCRFVDLARAANFDAADFYDLVHQSPIGARKTAAFLANAVAGICQR